MAEPKQLNDEELAMIAGYGANHLICDGNIDALLSHIAWLEGERDHAVAQSEANLDSWEKALDSFNQATGNMAESTRTRLVEVVKEMNSGHCSTGNGSAAKQEIITALESTELGSN